MAASHRSRAGSSGVVVGRGLGGSAAPGGGDDGERRRGDSRRSVAGAGCFGQLRHRAADDPMLDPGLRRGGGDWVVWPSLSRRLEGRRARLRVSRLLRSMRVKFCRLPGEGRGPVAGGPMQCGGPHQGSGRGADVGGGEKRQHEVARRTSRASRKRPDAGPRPAPGRRRFEGETKVRRGRGAGGGRRLGGAAWARRKGGSQGGREVAGEATIRKGGDGSWSGTGSSRPALADRAVFTPGRLPGLAVTRSAPSRPFALNPQRRSAG